jgi:hypothetical protein
MNVLQILDVNYDDGYESAFFIVYTEDFSDKIHGRHISHHKMHITIDRNIEPDTLLCYDLQFVSDES